LQQGHNPLKISIRDPEKHKSTPNGRIRIETGLEEVEKDEARSLAATQQRKAEEIRWITT
jgi:hypothetical protein